MDFHFKFTKHFLDQWKKLDSKNKKFLQKKLTLVKENPFRFPKHTGYKFVFKVKISIDDKYQRLMYAVFMPDEKHITVLGIFNRKINYKDFEKIFKRFRK